MLAKLAALQVELIEQACTLERRGRIDAADVARATSARIAEFCAELQETAMAAARKHPRDAGLPT